MRTVRAMSFDGRMNVYKEPCWVVVASRRKTHANMVPYVVRPGWKWYGEATNVFDWCRLTLPLDCYTRMVLVVDNRIIMTECRYVPGSRTDECFGIRLQAPVPCCNAKTHKPQHSSIVSAL